MKKVIGKTFLVLISLALVICMFAGCITIKEKGKYVTITPTPNPVPENYRGEITFSGFKSFEKDESNFEYIANFNANYPGVEVTYDEVYEDEYFATLDEKIMDGSIGDVFVMDAARLAKYASMGKIIDLSPYLEGLISYKTFKRLVPQNILFKAAYDAAKYNGQYFMSPVEYSHEFVFINYSVFEKAGLTSPQDKWTWDDFYEIAEKVSTVEGIEKAVAIDCGDYAVWGAFARSYGDKLFTYDSFGNIINVNLTDADVMKGIGELTDFASKDYVENVQISEISAEELEKYGMIVCDRSDFERWAPYLDKTDEYDFEWDLIHFPRFSRDTVDEKGEPAQAIYYNIGGKTVGLAVKVRDDIADEDERDEHYRICATFALYSLEEDAAIKYCGEGETVPAIKDVNDMKFWREYPLEGKNTSVFSLFSSNDYTAFLTPFINYDASLEFTVGDAVKAAAEGRKDLRDSLQKIQDAVNSYM
ncbi:MAG: extracellular solute-binding protein [Clostridia bacterium]|nr:extracellular solute-binding protein [Clostridia bacterium]